MDVEVPSLPLTRALWEVDDAAEEGACTVGEAALAAARAWPDAVALVDGANPRRRWTFTELAADAETCARALADRFAPGEHLAVWGPNRPEWVVLEIGSAMAGLVLVTVNPALGAAEAAYVLGQSESVGVVVEPTFHGVDLVQVLAGIRPDLPQLREVLAFDDFTDLLAGAPTDPMLPAVGAGDPAQIQYTSGTTGFPKGALLAHRGLTRNGLLFGRVTGAGPGDVWLNPMPLFHTAGCGLVTLGALQTGGTQVLLPGFDPDLALDLVASQRVTHVLGVPTMLVRVLQAQRDRPRDVSSLRRWSLGGAPVSPELVHQGADLLGAAMAIGFGQTEASPYLTHTVVDDPHAEWEQTVGRPLPQVSVRIVDPGSGGTAALDEVGEICTRSVCVMIGYHRDEEATAAAIDADGWLHTGDLGSMDESGYVRVKGRLKDLIIRGGENVYPREVEDVLLEHPAVVDASVVGMPDAEWGEQVAAFVRTSAPVDAEELRAFCRDRLASFKTPRVWRFVDEFPQTASGKVRKTELRELLAPRGA